MKREIFKFKNSKGMTIKGVLFAPETKPLAPAVLYLPGAVLGPTAVHRLGVDLACRLADDGHATCLFDPSGVGESEGDYPAGTHQEVSAWVEAGNCVEDTIETIDFLSSRFGLRDFLLVGHCGGALTAVYAAPGQRAIRSLFLISPPTVLVGEHDELDNAGMAESYFKLYASKAFSPEAWRRLLSGQSSYRTIARLVTTRVKRQLGRLRGRSASTPVVEMTGANAQTHGGKEISENVEAAAHAGEKSRVFNQRFLEALKTAHSEGKRIAIVVGDRDPGAPDFRAFARQHLPSGVATRIFDETSHGFITENSLALLFGEVVSFIGNVNRPGPPAAAPG
jgi:pimeloyl-ACP methyl ester carboxylesterase